MAGFRRVVGLALVVLATSACTFPSANEAEARIRNAQAAGELLAVEVFGPGSFADWVRNDWGDVCNRCPECLVADVKLEISGWYGVAVFEDITVPARRLGWEPQEKAQSPFGGSVWMDVVLIASDGSSIEITAVLRSGVLSIEDSTGCYHPAEP